MVLILYESKIQPQHQSPSTGLFRLSLLQKRLRLGKRGNDGGLHSSEVAFALRIQPPQVQIPAHIFSLAKIFLSLLLSSWTVQRDRIHLVQARDFANADSGDGLPKLNTTKRVGNDLAYRLWSLLQKKVWLSISSVVGSRSVGIVVSSNDSSRKRRSAPPSADNFSYFRRKASARAWSSSLRRLIRARKSPRLWCSLMDSVTQWQDNMTSDLLFTKVFEQRLEQVWCVAVRLATQQLEELQLHSLSINIKS